MFARAAEIPRIELTQAPEEEPLSLAEARYICRVDGTDHDAHLGSLIVGARQACEQEIGQRLVTQRWAAWFDRFDHLILRGQTPVAAVVSVAARSNELVVYGLSPVASIVSISYLAESDGSTITLDAGDYRLIGTKPARIAAAWGTVWPSARPIPEAVRVEVACGFGAAAAVPDALKLWMKAHVKAAFSGDPMPEQTERLLDPFRVWVVA